MGVLYPLPSTLLKQTGRAVLCLSLPALVKAACAAAAHVALHCTHLDSCSGLPPSTNFSAPCCDRGSSSCTLHRSPPAAPQLTPARDAKARSEPDKVPAVQGVRVARGAWAHATTQG
jgi:hypothetical protein